MKTLSNTSTTVAIQTNSLMWLKREGYQQHTIQHTGRVAHDNLMWLKANDFLLNFKVKSGANQIASEDSVNQNQSIYYSKKYFEAKRDFYFTTMGALILAIPVIFIAMFS